MIKILDCTLRDGGYLNNWDFGKNNIDTVISLLSSSHIDYIECGFLKNIKDYDKNITLYNNANILKSMTKTPLTLMLNYGEDISNLVLDKNIEIRLAFKPHQLQGIKGFTKPLLDKGYMISLNPMHIGLYSDENLNTLVDITNELNPTCLTLVDTMGILHPDETENIFRDLDKKILEDIPFGFHSHNNLNLSEINIIKLLDMKLPRDIIIDTSINGVSRGGGMPSTKDAAIFLNSNYGDQYDIDFLEKADKLIKKILPMKDTKQAYYYSATFKCHPNYAGYLLSKKYPISSIPEILAKIPEKNKIIYSQKVIENIINS